MLIPFRLFILSLCLFAPAVAKAAGPPSNNEYRFEAGIFQGRIARTQSGNTVPFNTNNGTYFGGEAAFGSGWQTVLGGSSSTFNGTVATASGTSASVLSYGDARLGFGYRTEFTAVRLMYYYQQTPYTDSPQVNTLVPSKASIGYARVEVLLQGKAKNHRVEFYSYLNQQLGATSVEGGSLNNKYYLGGCARVFIGEKFRVGSSICLDLQEMELPQSAVVSRQEFHGHVTFGF